MCSDAQRDLRPDAETEPKREDRRQHHARKCIYRFHVGIEHCSRPRLPRKPESDQHATNRADHECEDRFDQCDPEMFPNDAAREPSDDLFCDVNRIGKEEWRQDQSAENGVGGEHIPKCDTHYRHQHLQQEEIDARHCDQVLLVARA